MTILTAHRILISTAIVFFFGFGLWELRNYFSTSEPWSSLRAFLYLLIAVGFGIYLRSLRRWLK